MCSVDRAERNKRGTVCIWGESSPGLTDSLHRESASLYTTERQGIYSPLLESYTSSSLQMSWPSLATSSSIIPCPTNRDCKPINSFEHTCCDAVSRVWLTDQYLEGWLTIAEGGANQGGEARSRSRVRVDSDGSDLPAIAM
jgi:hypothetical protein